MGPSRLFNLISCVTAGVATIAVIATSSQAHAWGYEDRRTYHGPVYVHPIHPVIPIYHHPAPSVYWRTGHWVHSWHENRFGWWWVNGLGWSFYTAPVYPYPEPYENQTTIIYQSAPAPVVVQAPPPATNPVVTTAPAAPVPGDQAPPQGTGLYYFCESSQLYYPYARTCSERWKTVPQAPVD